MESPKTTLIKPKKIKEKEQKQMNFIPPLIMLTVGIILLTNSSKAVIIVCYILGAIVLLFGAIHLIKYYQLKSQLHIEDNQKLIIGIIGVFVGLLIILLSSAIETLLRFIIGFSLLFNGISKISIAISEKNTVSLFEGIVFIIAGLYTILATNIVFQIIGVLLIIASVFDLLTYFKEIKK